MGFIQILPINLTYKYLLKFFTLTHSQSSHPTSSPTYSAGSPISLSRLLAPRFPPSLTRGLCIALVPISRGPVWDLFSKNQFCRGKGLVYIRFQPALDILVVSLLVAGVVGQPVGFFLGVTSGFI